MNIFYTTRIERTTAILDDVESHHCIKVLRLKVGDLVSIVDGAGGYYEGKISIADHRSCIVEILKTQKEFEKRNFRLHIAIAPTKNIDRLEWFLEKATEIGIDEITPLLCQHSERKILRTDRLEKVLISAMKQSLKAYKPLLNQASSFEKFITQNLAGNKLIAHCVESERFELIKSKPIMNEFTILIGPEGDFSEMEIKNALENKFLPVMLGKSRLRTETAGVVSCQIIADLMSLK